MFRVGKEDFTTEGTESTEERKRRGGRKERNEGEKSRTIKEQACGF
jgi:hypothetical protein